MKLTQTLLSAIFIAGIPAIAQKNDAPEIRFDSFPALQFPADLYLGEDIFCTCATYCSRSFTDLASVFK
jgi:hypothetical protein